MAEELLLTSNIIEFMMVIFCLERHMEKENISIKNNPLSFWENGFIPNLKMEKLSSKMIK